MTENTSHLLQLGQEHEVLDYSYRLKIDEPLSLWIVEEGSVDIFAIKMEEGEKEGPHTFIIQRKKGGIFFPFSYPIKGYKSITIVNDGSKIKKIPLPSLQKALETNEVIKLAFIDALNSWTKGIYKNLIDIPNNEIKAFLPQEKTETFTPTKPIDIACLFTQKTKDQIQWIITEEGTPNILGKTEIQLTPSSPPFPLSDKVWLTITGKNVLTSIFTKELIEKNLWEKAISSFREHLFCYLISSINEREEKETQRILYRKTLEEKFLDSTLHHLSDIFEKHPMPAVDDSANHLIQACQIIGYFSDVFFIIPSYLSAPEHLFSTLNELCEHSSIRYHKVKLEKNWWKKDTGNLLAFLKEENTPVALIKKAKGYDIINPKTKERKNIDPSIANELVENAFLFFRPLPEEKISGKKVIKFCIFNKKKDLLTLFLLGLISIFLALYVPIANGLIFNRVIPFFDTNLLKQIALGLFSAAIGSAIFSFTSSFAALRLQNWSNIRLQTALMDRLLRLPVSFFRKFTIGDLLKRVFSITEIRSLLSSSVFSSLFSGIFSFLYLFIMLFYSWQLTLLSIGILSIGLLINCICIYKKIKIDTYVLEKQGKFNSFILEAISGLEKVRLTGSENILFSKWGDRYAHIKKQNLRSNNIGNLMQAWNTMLPAFGLFCIFAGGVFLTLKGKNFQLGNFIAFNAAFGSFSSALYQTSITAITSFGMIIPRWKRASVILQEKTEERENKFDPGRLKGFISVENLHFRYDEQSPFILQNISLEIQPGEFIAIIGSSGCGKSTFIRLLLQFNLPTIGSIYYDGKNLSELDVTKVRKQLGVVLQDASILSGSIEENLICGGIYTKEQIEKASQLTGFDEVLKDFPMGLQTFLTEGGKNLSGGQKQLLLITRALIGNPKILIFDEATNALDNRTQEKVMKNIESLKITRITIAHRLSTVYNADRIYVFSDGKIESSGTFNELLTQSKLFASFIKKQQL